MMIRALLFALTLCAATGGCTPARTAAGQAAEWAADRAAEETTAEQAAERMLQAHGGPSAWAQAATLSMQRRHQFQRWDQPIEFSIWGEIATQRIHQRWVRPAGTVVWDGERAWSVDWPLADRFLPRFVTSIGFFLVNLPWYLNSDQASGLGLSFCPLFPGEEKRYPVVTATFEADMVRKPRGYAGPRDRFHVYLDPVTYRVAGVLQERTYAGQLDAAAAPATINRIVELFVIETYVDASGLSLPGRYSVYSPDGEPTARGEFYGYRLNEPEDPGWFAPASSDGLRFDNSSSVRRQRAADEPLLPATPYPCPGSRG